MLRYLGDIPIVTSSPRSAPCSDGTMSNLPGTEAGAVVRHAARRGPVGIFGCFEDATTPATHRKSEVHRGAETGAPGGARLSCVT